MSDPLGVLVTGTAVCFTRYEPAILQFALGILFPQPDHIRYDHDIAL